jgi:hypothetical protein
MSEGSKGYPRRIVVFLEPDDENDERADKSQGIRQGRPDDAHPGNQ